MFSTSVCVSSHSLHDSLSQTYRMARLVMHTTESGCIYVYTVPPVSVVSWPVENPRQQWQTVGPAAAPAPRCGPHEWRPQQECPTIPIRTLREPTIRGDSSWWVSCACSPDTDTQEGDPIQVRVRSLSCCTCLSSLHLSPRPLRKLDDQFVVHKTSTEMAMAAHSLPPIWINAA